MDGQGAQHAVPKPARDSGPCGAARKFGQWRADLTAAQGQSFLLGNHTVTGQVADGGEGVPLGGTPACISNGKPASCDGLVVSPQAGTPGQPSARFNHSWDTLPVFYFSANASGPETDEAMRLIARFHVAILSPSLGNGWWPGLPAWRDEGEKLAQQTAILAKAAPNTDVVA